jgi:hypothetical protein
MPDRHSSHFTILRWLGEGRDRRMLVADLDHEILDVAGPVDAILYGDTLEHPTDPLRVVVDLDRAPAPDSFVVISVPNIAHLYIRLLHVVGRFAYLERGILDNPHLRFFTARSLKALIADAGLTIKRSTATLAAFYQVLPISWHQTWIAATHAVNAAIARRLPRLLGCEFIVLAGLKSGILATSGGG